MIYPFILKLAKLEQYSETKLNEDAFKKCQTSVEDQAQLLMLKMPSSLNQAVCYIRSITGAMGVLSPDGTYDIKRIAQQFIDYGYAIPDDIDTLAMINIDKEPTGFAVNSLKFFKKNEELIDQVFFRN